MSEYNEQYYQDLATPNVHTAALSRTFMARVFSWMFLALTITAITSFVWAATPSLFEILRYPTGKLTLIGWIVLLAPLGFVLLMSFGIQKLPAPIMVILFIVYSLLMGMSLSFIFLLYNLGTIGITFGITSAMFGVMAITGYVTKTDLTKFGSILMMGLVGIIIAMFVNFFMKSEMMGYIISIIGVLIFTGLTAYDVQRLKKIGTMVDNSGSMVLKMSILGALTLYLDFINLFLFLLRLMGGRK
ncbi:MAG: Bax inhibitor-1/YccA family protein [Bacteroidota bacterium]